jgi:hypothetical protein
MSYFKIRYRGRLRHSNEVMQLADEVEDICQSNGWKSHRWEEDWSKPDTVRMSLDEGALHTEGHAPLKGISFNPGPEMESIWLTFTPDGILNSLITLNDPTFTADDHTYPWNRVKTRFGDVNTHAEICNLFRYVADKYCSDFEVNEETGYWIHQDRERLEKFMNQIAEKDKQLEEELAAVYADENLDPEQKRAIMYDLMRQFGNDKD